MKRSRKRRSHTEVILDILTEASEGVNKTRLMYSCNLNFGLFNHYLKELLEAGLIEKTEENNPNGMTIYKTSAKGRELLEVLRKANKLLSS
ncbi:MAG: winged helix-turn-helix domain-containing protein [Candidatus Bathyarchaeales archaeon]